MEQHELRFDTRLRFGEDHVWNWQYLCHVRTLFIDTHPCYHKISDYGSPYALSFEEMDYLDGRLYALRGQLEQVFHTQLPAKPDQFFHILFLKEPTRHFTVTQLLSYYLKYHPSDTPATGYDQIAQTAYYCGLVAIRRAQPQQARLLLADMRRFLDKPWTLLRSTRLKTRLLIPLIKAGADGATLQILKHFIK